MRVVYAVTSFMAGLPDGGQYPVRGGQHWPADDPVVLAHPGMFSEDPRTGLETYNHQLPAGEDGPVEAATAAPGERRNVRRA
jgi:hypothetical protein